MWCPLMIGRSVRGPLLKPAAAAAGAMTAQLPPAAGAIPAQLPAAAALTSLPPDRRYSSWQRPPTCQLHGGLVSNRSMLSPTGVPPILRRHIWGWLNAIFNKVDATRIDAVGADRACAEWLLRCGAEFRWRSHPHWQSDYNSLPPTASTRNLVIEEINADNAAVMHIGFHHLRGLRAIRRVRLHYCGYVDDTAVRLLCEYLQHSLGALEISSCGNVTRHGLQHLRLLQNLRELKLFDLPEIVDQEACVRELKTLLPPDCRISFPPPAANTARQKT